MKISVLTPSFNSGKYLDRAVQSVLKQDYKNWEHIIMDGGSSDNTIDILKSYSHLNWESGRDKGQSDAMNKAFAKSTGDIIIYLNADDELGDGLLAYAYETFKNHPEIDMLIGDVKMNALGVERLRTPSVHLHEILSYWPCRFPLNPVSYLYKRSVQQTVGPFPIDNHYSMDYWFLLRAYRFARIKKSNRIFGTYYIDGANKSADTERSKEQLRLVRNDFVKQNLLSSGALLFLLNYPLNSFKRMLYRSLTAVMKRVKA